MNLKLANNSSTRTSGSNFLGCLLGVLSFLSSHMYAFLIEHLSILLKYLYTVSFVQFLPYSDRTLVPVLDYYS